MRAHMQTHVHALTGTAPHPAAAALRVEYRNEPLDALLAERTGRPRDEFSGFAPRVPVNPVAIGDLARLDPPQDR